VPPILLQVRRRHPLRRAEGRGGERGAPGHVLRQQPRWHHQPLQGHEEARVQEDGVLLVGDRVRLAGDDPLRRGLQAAGRQPIRQDQGKKTMMSTTPGELANGVASWFTVVRQRCVAAFVVCQFARVLTSGGMSVLGAAHPRGHGAGLPPRGPGMDHHPTRSARTPRGFPTTCCRTSSRSPSAGCPSSTSTATTTPPGMAPRCVRAPYRFELQSSWHFSSEFAVTWFDRCPHRSGTTYTSSIWLTATSRR
jgi:hypothetical protein